ncbi:MAG: hypothetical protein R3247_01320 [Rhodothermales bacterium]|nr:hypothetical protein [Rhodothermales bacterium]
MPGNTPSSYAALERRLKAGEPLYQFTLSVETARAGSALLHPLPPETLFLGAWTLAALLSLPRRTLDEAIEEGAVDVFLAIRSGRRDTFCALNERMEAFCRRHASHAPLQTLSLPVWLSREQVMRGARQGAFRWQPGEAGPVICADFAWLRWVASQAPEAERRRILRRQIVRGLFEEPFLEEQPCQQ